MMLTRNSSPLRAFAKAPRVPGLVLVSALLAAACSVSTLPGTDEPALRETDDLTATNTGGSDVTGPATGDMTNAPHLGSAAPSGPSNTPMEPGRGTPGERAPAGGSTVGVTADSLTITASGFWSGPYSAFTNKQFENGFMTWVTEVNQKGGIHGRRIVVKKVDNQGTAEGAVAACKEEQTNGTFAVVAFASMASEHDCMDTAGLPALIQVAERDPEHFRTVRGLSSLPGEGAGLASFASARLAADKKRVGVIVLDSNLTVASAKGFAAAADQMGIEVVRTERVAQNQASFVAELSRLRNAGADVVALFVLTEVIGILRDAKAIDYRPSFTGTIWAADEISQAARNLLEGVVALRTYATTNSPGFAEYRAEMARQGKANPSTTDALHYGIGRVLGHVLELAGRDLTRESFTAAADRVRGFDAKLVPPVSWAPPDPIGGRAQFPVVCCNPDGTWRGLGPPQERF